MVQRRLGNNRVVGRLVGAEGNGVKGDSRVGLTDEQKAQREKETQAGYEAWRAAREARKAKRYDGLRARNLGR